MMEIETVIKKNTNKKNERKVISEIYWNNNQTNKDRYNKHRERDRERKREWENSTW